MTNPMQIRLILAGITMLIGGSYMDNVRGPLLPLLANDLKLPYAETSFLLVWGNLTAVVMNLTLLPAIHRWGVKAVSLGICVAPVGVCLLGYFVRGPVSLGVFAAMLGGVLATLGVICNLLVMEGAPPESHSRFLCALHMMYGLGSLFGPMGIRWTLGAHHPWQTVFWLVLPVFAIVGSLLISTPGNPRPVARSTLEISKGPSLNRTHAFLIGVFCIYVVGEVLTSMWMVPFLVNSQGMSVESAAPLLSGFFLAMGLTRGICFLSIRPQAEQKFLLWVLGISFFFSWMGQRGSTWALPMVGLVGPFFPLFLGRMTRQFPEVATKLTVAMLTAMQLSLAISHLGMGVLTDHFGINLVYWASTGCLGMAFVLSSLYFLKPPQACQPNPENASVLEI